MTRRLQWIQIIQQDNRRGDMYMSGHIDRLKIIVNKWLNLDETGLAAIEEDELLSEYGLNSLGTMEVVVAIEDAYDIEIEDDDLMVEELGTLRKLNQLVMRYLSSKGE